MQPVHLRRPSLKPTLEFITKRKRKQFGQHRVFNNSKQCDSVDIASCWQQLDDENQPEFRVQLDAECQFSSSYSYHEVNTEHRIGVSVGVNHVEGGWPKDVYYLDLEQTMRYRKKNEKDEFFIQTISQLGKLVEHGIQQNNALNIFRKHFTKNKLKSNDTSIRLNSICRQSFDHGDVSVSGLSWNNNKKLAAAYSHLFNQSEERTPKFNCKNEAIVWDIINCNIAELTLIGPSAPVCVEFNNKDSNSIIGGCYNGQVACWDIRRGPLPVEMTDENGHHDIVRSVVWLNSKTGTEFFSGSVDGQVCWWDIRKMNQPIDNLYVDPSKSTDLQIGNALGVTLLEFEPTMSTKFMIGTEEGTVFVCNSKAKTMAEKLAGSFSGHLGPVKTLQRNPVFPKNILTVGDWSAKIWSEDIRQSPIINTGYYSKCLTGGCWNPTIPSIFFTITDDGYLELWDLLVFHHRPFQQTKISDCPLTAIRVQESGRLVACGSSDGSIGIVDISDDITVLDKNEKSTLTALFERETRREKILEARLREQKAMQRSSNITGDLSKGDGQEAMELYKSFESEYTELYNEEQ